MEAIGIIPARYASSRFPGKPLVDIHGKSMIRRVYEQVRKAVSLSAVYVATDDERIMNAVIDFGGQAVMTSAEHLSGTDRCNEVVDSLIRSGEKIDVVVNIQGDEPYIQPQQIDLVLSCFKNADTEIATLAKQIETEEELFSTNVNKVIIDRNKQAIYFSRTPIPFLQNIDKQAWISSFDYYKHIGIYAYKPGVLKEISRLEQTKLEKAESLEQLRWLEHGYSISVEKTQYESIAIDTPEDLSKIINKS